MPANGHVAPKAQILMLTCDTSLLPLAPDLNPHPGLMLLADKPAQPVPVINDGRRPLWPCDSAWRRHGIHSVHLHSYGRHDLHLRLLGGLSAHTAGKATGLMAPSRAILRINECAKYTALKARQKYMHFYLNELLSLCACRHRCIFFPN